MIERAILAIRLSQIIGASVTTASKGCNSASPRRSSFFFTLILLTTLISSITVNAAVEVSSLYRVYDDGKTQVMSPHVDISATVFSEQLTISADYAMDTVTSASSDVKSFASSDVEEKREEFGTGLALNLDKGTFGLGYIQSDENDYHSKLYSLSGTRELFEKNTTIGIGLVYGNDIIESSSDESYKEFMTNETYSLSLTQVINPVSVIQFLLDIRIESGVLNSPYRKARQETNEDGVYRGLQENLPRTRNRYAYTVKYNYFFQKPKLAWSQSLRIYNDSWGVMSATLEEKLTRQWGFMIAALSLRYSRQEGATFYQDIYGDDLGPFYTGNKSLGTYDSYHLGFRPTFQIGKSLSLFLKGEYYLQNFTDHTDLGDIDDPDDNKKLTVAAFILGAGFDLKF